MNLADPGTLKRFLARNGITVQKDLGQHFLCSEHVVDKIVYECQGLASVLEVGPGPGILTSALCSTVPHVVALEVDVAMGNALRESSSQARLIFGDALRVDLAEIFESLPEPRGLVSNLPYYITAPLLTRFAEYRSYYVKSLMMMQKEVAARIAARAGEPERGSLSVFLQSQFEVRGIIDAPARLFLPPPKVDSRVLEFKTRETVEPESFYRFVRMGFVQPGKTLINNLAPILREPKDWLADFVYACGIDESARPKDLTLEQWKLVWQRAQSHAPELV